MAVGDIHFSIFIYFYYDTSCRYPTAHINADVRVENSETNHNHAQ